MKSRILTGMIIFMALLISLVLMNTDYFKLVISFISVASVYEIFKATGYMKNRLLLIVSMLYAFMVPFFGTNFFDVFTLSGFDTTVIFVIFVLIIMLYEHERLTLQNTAMIFMFTLIFPFAFSCMVYVRDLPKFYVGGVAPALTLTESLDSAFKGGYPYAGLFYVALIFVGSWVTDVGAYFTGRFFGKHKMAPTISPKKTWEGAVGGALLCLVVFTGFAVVYQNFFVKDLGTVNIWITAIIAIPCAVAGMLGDLVASYIKRSCNIKDFGNLMPGHGGIIDRFDSLLLVAPLMLLLAKYLPIIEIAGVA